MDVAIKKFSEMVEQMNDGTFDATENGKCTQCGNCCSNRLPMTDNEINVIRRYIKKNRIKESKHAINVYAQATLDFTCPFLNDDKPKEKCSIYPVRPKVCRDFICCPEKRPKVEMEWARKSKVINVRETFFGGK